MGAIFPMAPLKARQGFVRKRERQAERAAKAQGPAATVAVDTEKARLLAGPLTPTDRREL